MPFRPRGAFGSVYRRDRGYLGRASCDVKNEVRYSGDASCLYCAGSGGRAGAWAADFRFYGMAGICDQLGDDPGTVVDGDRSVRTDGDGFDASDQFCGSGYYSRTQWNCRGSGDGWVLCQYGRVCRGFLPGKRGKRFAGARFGDEHAPDRQYCEKTCDLAAGDYNECSARPGFHDDIRDGE